jgi:uncharacterized Zn-finger protein
VEIDAKTQSDLDSRASLNSTNSTTSSNSESTSNFLPTDLNSYVEDALTTIIGYLKPILEPVKVTYSNELLAEQINGIAILLFILSIIIIFLFIIFSLNAIILIYRDRIVNYFTNKYIRAYLQLNTSIIVLELVITSITILYFLFALSRGLQFIARHPIFFS